MKYRRLTKEQFESLHEEFANFLATQGIDKAKWEQLKNENSQIVDEELDLFSDLIWEGVLKNSRYLEHYSKKHIFLFFCKNKIMQSIVIIVNKDDIDLMSKEGLAWLNDHLFSEFVEIRQGKKKLDIERNAALFDLIEKGAILSDGQLFHQLHNIINSLN